MENENIAKNYQVCTICIMDTTDQDISFDEEGVCNYCIKAKELLRSVKFTELEQKTNLVQLKQKIIDGKNGRYDSIVGVSGGVDSSYVVHLAHELGLNPLLVHFDNGWNSELAVSNIQKLIRATGFDLVTYVIDWEEFKDLQRAFIKAGVIDIEMLTDHAIMATMYNIRKQYGIKYVISGTNISTEFGLPQSWVWNKQDLKNIIDIQSKFGTRKIKKFPTMSSLKRAISKKFGIGGEYVEILNMINYSKRDAINLLHEKYDWIYYGDKHFESIFTRFYQGYILRKKFLIDKRRVHLSAQIRNGEINRDEALDELAAESYTVKMQEEDKYYVLKKLGFDNKEFEDIMNTKPVSHNFFRSDFKNGISALLIKGYQMVKSNRK